jgi:DNA-binding CsgD family transcriptional regulator
VLAGRARKELVAAGARPRRLATTGAGALTASERRVAAMAAGGMANRDIAQALFVTRRTVEGHLTHAFRKLGSSCAPARRRRRRLMGASPHQPHLEPAAGG